LIHWLADTGNDNDQKLGTAAQAIGRSLLKRGPIFDEAAEDRVRRFLDLPFRVERDICQK
jgi:hypothetical protein